MWPTGKRHDAHHFQTTRHRSLFADQFSDQLKILAYSTAICLLFIGGSLAGRITGHWQTGISNVEYLFHIQNLDMPFYQHNRGEVPAYNKEAWLQMMKKIREGRGAMRQAHGNAKQAGAEH